MTKIQLPPMPKPADFMNEKQFMSKAYEAALASWREVCGQVVNAEKSTQFWKR